MTSKKLFEMKTKKIGLAELSESEIVSNTVLPKDSLDTVDVVKVAGMNMFFLTPCRFHEVVAESDDFCF